MGQGDHWTPGEDATLHHEWETTAPDCKTDITGFDKRLADRLVRGADAVRRRRAKLGLVLKIHRWTPEEDQRICAANRPPDHVLARELGVSMRALYTRRYRFGGGAEREINLALPPGWFGPPGTPYAEGVPWVPGAAFKRPTP